MRQVMLVLITFSMLSFLSCDETESTHQPAAQGGYQDVENLTPRPVVAPHLWNKADFETSLNKLSGMGGVLTREVTVEMAPPYYKGEIPFSYVDKAVYVPGGMYSPNIDIPIYHEYANWRTVFIYTDTRSAIEGIPDGAQTLDAQTGRVLAEAKNLGFVKGEGFDIEERHYGSDGELIFHCKSRISFGTGWKTNESDAQGQKQTEYYSIFPSG